MRESQKNISSASAAEQGEKSRKRGRGGVALKVAKWTGIVLSVLVGVPVILLVVLSLWLTSDRLTALVNKEGSKYLNADIHADRVDYSLWRTFPRFRITTGRVELTSRSLDSVSPEIRKQLPDSAAFLGSVRSFTGEINVVDLFMNRYVLHDVNVDGLRINLVAYNDSVNNFNILPTTGGGFKKVPYIRANKIELKNPGSMSYMSVATDTRAALNLQSLLLERQTGKGAGSNTYRLGLGGKVTASSAGLEILNGFPFSLDGELQLRFDPFGVSLKDYSIDLGEIKSSLTMSVGIGDDPRIESFDYKIKSVSLTGLLGYLPKEFVPSLQGIKANLQVSASARLISAWRIQSETLPSIAVDFKVPEGNVDYTLALNSKNAPGRMKTYAMRHTPISAEFVFNGEDPAASYITVNPFAVSSGGVKVTLGMMISQLTSHPAVTADINVNADVAETLPLLPFTPPVKASGRVDLVSKVGFTLSDLSKEGLEQGLRDFSVAADLKAADLAISAPGLGLKGNIKNFRLMVAESSSIFNTTGIVNPELAVDGSLSGVSMAMNGGSNLKAGGFKFTTGLNYSGTLTPQKLEAGLPMELKGSVSDVKYSDAASDVSVSAPLISFMQKISRRNGSSTQTVAEKVSVAADPAKEVVSGSESSVVPTEIAHTPEFIRVEIPESLKELLGQYSFTTKIQSPRINIHTRGLGRGNYISNLDLMLDGDEVSLNNMDVMIKKTRANLQAHVSNLRRFLSGPVSESNPLVVDVNLALDTVNINALARAYVESKGGMDNIPRHTKVTASDSVALLVPRNLAAHVKFSARETLYTNLDLYDLGADINLRKGVVDIPNLGVGASFGRAGLNVLYNGYDPDHLSLNLGLDVEKVDIVKFFKKFHALLEMMPEMKNLSGTLSAKVDLGCRIFPDMYINMPGTTAQLDVKGRGLTVRQSKFIRKITKMMLIHTDDDIHIHNLDVHAGIHDNLLQLDPFYFEFDRYRLQMLGINNFNGDLYYHIAVDKSPVPIPFSVNILGQFHNPKLRFGGPHYDDKRAEEVTSQIQEENNINMVLILRQFLRAFIGKAATATSL